MRAIFKGAVVVTAMAWGACSFSASTRTLNTKKAETAIAKGIQEQLGAVVRVVCPHKVKLKSGKTFNCRAVPENQGPLKVEVTMTDNKGHVSWKVSS